MATENFEKGFALRTELAGKEYVDKVFSDPNDYSVPLHELLTEFCWGAVWSRPGLDRRSRSILNLGMLSALNRSEEFAGHVKIALKNGVTKDEIRECLLQVAVYCGMPAGVTAFRVARKVFEELGV
ncbi:carboxymuconolactone decarboxylase family protein [Paraburkholderia sp. JHI869]|uniref:carboxymuconolactone decarboxylase family protein n=1 Tax=Paraburkholderia sp. JHI869 TaxID=3112959 RepID=UPI0031817D92